LFFSLLLNTTPKQGGPYLTVGPPFSQYGFPMIVPASFASGQSAFASGQAAFV